MPMLGLNYLPLTDRPVDCPYACGWVPGNRSLLLKLACQPAHSRKGFFMGGRSRTPSVIKRVVVPARSMKAMRSTDKPAQPNLSMGIGTNGLSTYEGAGIQNCTRKKNGSGKQHLKEVRVTACLFLTFHCLHPDY